MGRIETLERQLQEDWRFASYATSGAEGCARMGTVRETQLELAHALLEEGGAGSEQKARDLFVEVLSSREGLSHSGQLDSLRSLLARLGEPTRPVMLEIAEKHLHHLEFFADRSYRSPSFQPTLRFLQQVLEDVPEKDELLGRARALRVD